MKKRTYSQTTETIEEKESEISGGGGIGMKRKITIYLTLILLVASIFLFLMMAKIFEENEITKEQAYASSVVDQTKENLVLNRRKSAQVQKLFESDYLNRLYFAKYLVTADEDGNITRAEWNHILSLVDVNNIHVVDSNGTIVQSSQKNSIGLNFYEEDSLAGFRDLLDGKEKDNYHIQYDGESLTLNQNMIYLGVRTSEEGGMIQIEVCSEMLKEYQNMASIETYVASIPTRWYRILFVLDKMTGEIVGISENNVQKIEMEDRLLTLEKLAGTSGIVTANQKKQLATVREYDDMLIVCLTEMDELNAYTIDNMLRVILYLILLMAIMVPTLYFIIDRLVIRDMQTINQKLAKFVEGDTDVYFNVAMKRTKEMSNLANNLNKVIGVFKTRGERMTVIASMLGEGCGAYEYYADLNQIYYSERLPELFGMSKEDCCKMIETKFRQEQPYLKDDYSYSVDPYTTSDGRTLRIRRTITPTLSYALIEDMTEFHKREERLSQSIQIEKEKAYTDVLTGLYNRKKLEEDVDSYLEENKEEGGVMLLMDMDNFKRVNDELGHQAGDKLLKEFADLLQRQFRKSDRKVRLGGDEFVVFIPGAIKKEDLIEKVKRFQDVTREELKEYHQKYGLSISIGIAYISEECGNYEDLYKFADAAMYIAKRAGKNRFYMHESKNLFH